MSTPAFDIFIKAWPITIAMVGVIATLAVTLYRVKTHARVLFGPSGELLYCSKAEAGKIKEGLMNEILKERVRLDIDEKEYLKLIDHERICDNSRMQTQAAIRDMKDEIAEKVAKDMKSMLDTQSKIMLSAIKSATT